MHTKAELRTQLNKRFQNIEKEGDFWDFCPEYLLEHVSGLLALSETVAGYVAMHGEVDPSPLLDMALDRRREIALPYLASRDAKMEFRFWCPGEPLAPAGRGFLQPLGSARPATPDIIITPLMGFDDALNRLGRGAGHYDRYFASGVPALRIGLAWSFQQVEAIPADPWDAPLDAVLTERQWFAKAGTQLP